MYVKNFPFRVSSSSYGVDQSDQNKLPNELKKMKTQRKLF